MRIFATAFGQIIGDVVLVSIVIQYVFIAVAVITADYCYAAVFRRSSARVLKVSGCFPIHCKD